jgi:hypothetical protein
MTPIFASDDVDASATVVGGGLMLTTARDGQVKLYVADSGHARPLGTFASVSAAWEAIDAIDLGTDEAAVDLAA